MKFINLLSLLLLFFKVTSAQNNEAILSDSVKIFAPGQISTGGYEFNTSFTPDGKTVFFTRSSIDFAMASVFYSSLINNKWSSPKMVFSSSVYRDLDPFVSVDGKRLYFCSDRPLQEGIYVPFEYHIYFVELKQGNVVSEPKLLEIEGNPKVLYPSLSANNNLYFCDAGKVYFSELIRGKYGKPVEISLGEGKHIDLDPIISSDETMLIFSSATRKGYGSLDLFVSFKSGGTWLAPINLGSKVNSKGKDATAGLSHDNKILYFSAYREKISTIQRNKRQFNKLLNSFQNGLPNIYYISIEDLKKQKDMD